MNINKYAYIFYYMKNKSPLRYPGGKSRACKILEDILTENFKIKDFTTIISPFFGGGSFEFYLQNKYNFNLKVNDKFKPLYNFWYQSKTNKNKLCEEIEKNKNINKDKFKEYRENIMDSESDLTQAVYFFIINRCSFSGATLSGGFSQEASLKRFTKSSIDKIKDLDLSKLEISNLDFEEFIKNSYKNKDTSKYLMFLDPPYYLEKGSKLYGDNGDMHESFDHKKLYKSIKNKKNWIMTYNDCEFIRDLYKDFKIIETSWSYGMNKTKESSELVIINVF